MEINSIKVMLDKGAYVPIRAHEWDAGLDIRTPERIEIRAQESAVIYTGVHVEIPNGYVGMIKSKSGLNHKNNITCEGVIDAGYTGQIVVKLYNHTTRPSDCFVPNYVFEPGDKIAQLVIMPIVVPKVTIVDSLEDTERGDNGFGSTGK